MKKNIRVFVKNIKAILMAIKTIIRLDAGYMFLLSASMILSTCIPFIDIYLLRSLINAVYEKGNSREAFLYLILFSAASFTMMSMKAYVMWYRSIHYIKFGHYYDVINARKILNIDYQKLQDKETLDMTRRAAKACSAIARIGEHTSDIVSELVKIIGTLAIMIPFCGNYVFLIIIASIACYLVDRYTQNQKYIYEKIGATSERKVDYFLGGILDVRSAKELRLFDAFHLFKAKYAQAEEELYRFKRRANLTTLINNSVNVLFTAFEIFLMYWLASERYAEGMMEIGDISLCVSSVTVFAGAMNVLFHQFAEVGILEKRMEDFNQFQKVDRDMPYLFVKSSVAL